MGVTKKDACRQSAWGKEQRHTESQTERGTRRGEGGGKREKDHYEVIGLKILTSLFVCLFSFVETHDPFKQGTEPHSC